MKSQSINRRKFLSASLSAAGGAVAFPQIIPASVLGANAPSNRINLAMIGTGNQGFQDMRAFLTEPDAQIVAVCDVNRDSGGYRYADQICGREPAKQLVEKTYASRRSAGTFRGCDAYADFREVLARPDIDAVVIVVPDHWHAIITILAARAGKDIYCEKPLSYTISEGRAMVEAVRQSGVVLQTGSHQRSNPRTRFGCELVRNGRIGQLQRIETRIGTWNRQGPPGDWSPMPVPDGFDYDMWIGPAPWEPYHKDRCLYTFRFMRDYSGGQVTNLGAHSFDMAQWGNNTELTGPIEVEDTGSEWPSAGLFNVAKVVKFRARYANGVELTCRTDLEAEPDRTIAQCKFIGSEGWIEMGSEGFFTYPESLKTSIVGANEIHLGSSTNHMRDFLDAIRARSEPAASVEIGHRSATICHIANIAMRLGRKLCWDPVAERFAGDDAANHMLTRAYRAPWTV